MTSNSSPFMVTSSNNAAMYSHLKELRASGKHYGHLMGGMQPDKASPTLSQRILTANPNACASTKSAYTRKNMKILKIKKQALRQQALRLGASGAFLEG